jgi:DNA invertase Pin-like site-specific DNA recombinase
MASKTAARTASKTVKTPVVDIYARLSYAANGETVKVDDQVEMGLEALERRGAVLGEAFRDNSLSAWQPGVVRPEWETLMRRLETGASQGVWVYDLTRFSRKVIEGERLVELAAKGIRVWAMAGEYDLTTADGRRHFRESMVAAAAESDKISERVKRGKLRRARKGRHHGGGRGYGMPGNQRPGPNWEPGDARDTVSEQQLAAEHEVIRECFTRILSGEGVSTVVRDLTGRGVVGVTGSPFTRSSLERMLRRPAVIGMVDHHGEIMGERVGVEPIVPVEEWQRLCALLDSRKLGRPPGMVHLLSGVMACGGCGMPLSGNNRPHLPAYPDGSVRREYRCLRNADRQGCGKIHIEAQPTEQAVAEAMRTRLGDPRRAAKMASHLAKVDQQRGRLEAEISDLEAAADELVTKTAAWGVARVDKAMAPLLARIASLQTKLAGLVSPAQAELAAADAVAAWEDAAERGDFPAMRAMIRRVFPNLTITAQTCFNDHGPHRILWDPPTTEAA